MTNLSVLLSDNVLLLSFVNTVALKSINLGQYWCLLKSLREILKKQCQRLYLPTPMTYHDERTLPHESGMSYSLTWRMAGRRKRTCQQILCWGIMPFKTNLFNSVWYCKTLLTSGKEAKSYLSFSLDKLLNKLPICCRWKWRRKRRELWYMWKNKVYI